MSNKNCPSFQIALNFPHYHHEKRVMNTKLFQQKILCRTAYFSKAGYGGYHECTFENTSECNFCFGFIVFS